MSEPQKAVITVERAETVRGWRKVWDTNKIEYVLGQKLTQDLQVGKIYTIEFAVVIKGQYTNRYVQKATEQPKSSPSPEQKYTDDDRKAFAEKDDRMAKESAYKSAVTMASAWLGYAATCPEKDAELARANAEKMVNNLASEYYRNITGRNWDDFIVMPEM